MVWAPTTASARDTHILVDLLVDVLCMVFPLAFMWFGFQVPMTVQEMLLVVAWPTVITVLKLDDLMEENVRRRTAARLAKTQMNYSFSKGHQRSSLFASTSVEKGLEAQLRSITNKTKWAITLITAAAMLTFLTIGGMTVAVQVTCHPTLWNACIVKIPFCRLKQACDCAVLYLDRHNFTRLPKALESMKGVRSMTVTRGPLTELPPLQGYKQLADVNASENRLKALPKFPSSLQSLLVEKNDLKSLNGIDEMPNLFVVFASYNNISVFPRLGDNLIDLRMTNNSLRVINNVRNLKALQVGGNQIHTLPMKSTVYYVEIFGNNLTSFPSWDSVEFLDARHNQLEALPNLNIQTLYVAGNPLCWNGWKASTRSMMSAMTEDGKGCSEQCSKTCLDEYVGDTRCDFQCYTEWCEYDEHDCR
jgi:hypothetical protein